MPFRRCLLARVALGVLRIRDTAVYSDPHRVLPFNVYGYILSAAMVACGVFGLADTQKIQPAARRSGMPL